MLEESTPTVAVASDDPTLLDEMFRYLEEIPNWRLVTAGSSVAELTSCLETHLPDAVLVAADLAVDLALKGRPDSAHGQLIVVGRQETTQAFKAALRLEARGFVAWPKEKSRLKDLVESNRLAMGQRSRSGGKLHAVWSPKGGSGASVIAAHLAACIHKAGPPCMLVDLDLDHADQTPILGAPHDSKSLLDLARMGDELSPSMIDDITWTHPDGFRVVLASGASGDSVAIKPAELNRIFSRLQEVAAHVVVDCPSGMSETALAMFEQATTVMIVVTPDLLSLRRASEALKSFRSFGLAESKFEVWLNQTGAASLSDKDVRAILGLKPQVQIRADLSLYHAANRGELSKTGKRMLARPAGRITKPAKS